jgi:NADH-quinone oxidoreductase subunit J
METALFYLFAALTLLSGLMVVANPFSRNPVTSAMFLVATIGSLAGLFVLLHAFFLAAVQILVYAGAVMVLFLFVIMLLDLRAEERRTFNLFGIGAGVIGVVSLGYVLVSAILKTHPGRGASPSLEGATVPLGKTLFSSYLLPFEIVSVVLLVAMVGVILLSKRDLR